MKKLMIVALAVCTSAVALAAPRPFSSNKPYKDMTDEEKAIRHQEAMRNRLEHFGENIVKPGSQKGRIAFVNAQSVVGESTITNVIAQLTRQRKYNVKCVKDTGDKTTPANATAKMKALGVDVAVFLVECDKCDNMMLVAPESGWAIVNASAVTKGAKDDIFRAARMRKEMVRGYLAACGAMNSKFPGSLMGGVVKPEDLDRLNESAPIDVIQRTLDALEKRGVTPELVSFYRRACEQGWAPQPTNDIQRAIWNDVHALPSDPIKIKFDPKRDK